ncbi:glycosyltransferase family 2 protein [Rhodococcus chondri]|uniref:Glycosyltransferase n=1 Tax=Rhodococcus chondri TaxID=3065941 RepID=A0ABU7JST7_9NOCA|nr:glycosyltransferase [Rhodococcus sp. CC-R104]MEE2033091.1 glycosyltransferase [Rhodococcus sp. CC-R104]
MSPTARTTVVIATRNRAAELAHTLEQLAVLRPPDSDRRRRQRERRRHGGRGASCPRQDVVPRLLRIVRLRRNEGAAARTVGARYADTEFVAFCDDDSWWTGGSISRAEKLFDEYPSVALLAASVIVLPSGRLDPVCAEMADSPLGHEPHLPGPSVLGFLACSVIVRRREYLAAGGFSRLLHFAGEETLLAWDLAASGWDLCFVGELQTCHRPSSSRTSSTARIRRELRNATLTVWLRRPAQRCREVAQEVARQVLRDPTLLPVVPELAKRVPAVLRQRHTVPEWLEARIRLLENSVVGKGDGHS